MTSRNILFSSLKFRILPLVRNLETSGVLRSCSNSSKLPKKSNNSQITKKSEGGILNIETQNLPLERTQYWNEVKAVRRLVKQNTYPRNVDNIIDLTNGLVSFRKNFPGTLKGFVYWLKKLRERRQIIEQKFLPKRHAILKPDLAAAHFLVRRGGGVKFVGQTHWVGVRGGKFSLPNTFVPGFYIEAINLEGSNLYYEGLENICDLNYLKSLSLKNLEHVDDWWLDWISSKYYLNLKHLDLTGCKNVTSRGLSCFYRFESLKTLNLEGIPDPPEFKLACLRLQDIMPELDIMGINLSLPEEIKTVMAEQSEALPKINSV